MVLLRLLYRLLSFWLGIVTTLIWSSVLRREDWRDRKSLFFLDLLSGSISAYIPTERFFLVIWSLKERVWVASSSIPTTFSIWVPMDLPPFLEKLLNICFFLDRRLSKKLSDSFRFLSCDSNFLPATKSELSFKFWTFSTKSVFFRRLHTQLSA